MSIALAGEAPRVTFAGVPMGHEFNSLVLALLYAGGHPPKVDEALLEQIRNLPGNVILKPMYPCPARAARKRCRP